MQLHFTTSYESKHGDTVSVTIKQNENEIVDNYSLQKIDENTWVGSLLLTKVVSSKIEYQLTVINEFFPLKQILLNTGFIKIKKRYKSIYINGICDEQNNFPDIRLTLPFKNALKPLKYISSASTNNKKATHIFNVFYPLLQENIFICLTGSAKKLNLFNDEKPILFTKKKNNKSELKFNFSKEKFPVEYKLAFYDINKKCIVNYEPGPNNILEKPLEKNSLTIINAAPNCAQYLWKGAGLNIPVFSLRTNATWGCGDFSSLKNLVDYSAAIGIKMIQLLPINDSLSTYTDKDSYPYSAISSFALNPLYLDVAQILNDSIINLSEADDKEIKRLEELKTCEFSGVIILKLSILRKVFLLSNKEFLKEKNWLIFFEKAFEWLIPYAAFCVLRDKYNTVDTTAWEDFSIYNSEKILLFTQPEGDYYEDILFWYFIQYHLHLQLSEATKYAHNRRIILKADLPIGVAKQSVDTWVYPELFHMNRQAGAPPDAFSSVGQNWQFPTYNIKKMKEDNFDWFIKRMKSLETYFDALRIDHVLGLFRIWSIPQNQIDGTMGIFVPSISLTATYFLNADIEFNEVRFCTPYITNDFLVENFGDDTENIRMIFFDKLDLKEEFNDQGKIAKYFKKYPLFSKYKQQLFDVVSNVILFKDLVKEDEYHFRINMQQTYSYQQLKEGEKIKVNDLYNNYFFENQNVLWQKAGTEMLTMISGSSKMLLCAEDLGMVPPFTEKVLNDLNILSLQIQQMPKSANEQFSDTNSAKYLTVVMPATHDMAPIRLWWEQNKKSAQLFFNTVLNEQGNAPYFCEPWVCKKIIEQHLKSPAMWSVFLLQDLLSIDGNIRRPIPAEERINDPSNPEHIWNYRMHLTIEQLLSADNLNNELKKMISENGR